MRSLTEATILSRENGKLRMDTLISTSVLHFKLIRVWTNVEKRK